MELTQADFGRHVLWFAIEIRVAEVIDLNPADDTEVLIRPSSGGRKWVPRDNIQPLPAGTHPGSINITADLLAFERLTRHVRELLEQVSKSDPVLSDCEIWTVVEKLALDVGYPLEFSPVDPGTMAVAGGLQDEPDPIDLQDAARGDFTPGS